MGKRSTASRKLYFEVLAAQTKLEALIEANQRMNLYREAFHRNTTETIEKVRADPKFANDKKKQDVAIDKLTDSDWKQVDEQRSRTVLAAKAWEGVLKTLPVALKAVKTVLDTYDDKGKDTKQAKAASAKSTVSMAEGLLVTLRKDIKFVKDMY